MNERETAELRALAERLLGLTESQGQGLMFSGPDAEEPLIELPRPEGSKYSEECLLRAAHSELERRRLRKLFLPSEWFSEGVWNILIDLYEKDHRGQNVSITSACIAADVPATTAIRNVSQLVHSGLVERVPDSTDGRRAFIRFTPKGRSTLRELLTSMIDSEISIKKKLGLTSGGQK